jgi:glycine/D-amino acid oxidase-like deaminating enzyme
MATAYSGTGMTYGTVAAQMLADFALGRQKSYAKLYDPARKKPASISRTS